MCAAQLSADEVCKLLIGLTVPRPIALGGHGTQSIVGKARRLHVRGGLLDGGQL